ncbi:ribosomal RNA small subunit methyltransferase NEP1-like [Chenopodium quinoa]|uniref:ribosomal RNA small subunit methyltransferase NEP1-like n=1 Tax=Chenopodium quinoa TaxID=63459 RepID=UPI000B78D477|nr:ribosomal RNA small subunit methyltransferase NEP1-like [Chenopodium quinoa]
MGKTKRKAESLQPCSTKRKELKRDGLVATGDEEERGEKELNSIQNEEDFNLCCIPVIHTCKDAGAGVTFVLEKASLTLAYIGKRYQIVSSNHHADFLRKKKMNPYIYRPDIVHRALRKIMASRLCKDGRLKAVYIRTEDGVLIKVEPYVKIPRQLEVFCDMMAELLQALSIKAKGSRKKLLRVVANPVTKYLSPTSHKIGLSYSSENAVDIREYINGISSDEDVVFAVGVMAHGKIDCDYIEDLVSGIDLEQKRI